MPAVVGQPAPDFTLSDENNNKVSLSDFRGHKAVIVFIPFPFSGICTNEVCAIRDDYSQFEGLDARVVIITCDQRFATAAWKKEMGIQFPILSDFWPHGAVAQAYGCFNEAVGAALRASYVLDKDGIVREIIQSEGIPHAREHAGYQRALAGI